MVLNDCYSEVTAYTALCYSYWASFHNAYGCLRYAYKQYQPQLPYKSHKTYEVAIETGAQVATRAIKYLVSPMNYTTSSMADQIYLVITVIGYVHVWPPDTYIEIVMTLTAFNAFQIGCMQFTIGTLTAYLAW